MAGCSHSPSAEFAMIHIAFAKSSLNGFFSPGFIYSQMDIFFGSVLDFVNTLLPYTLQHNPSLSNTELSCFTEVYIFYLGYQLSFSV